MQANLGESQPSQEQDPPLDQRNRDTHRQQDSGEVENAACALLGNSGSSLSLCPPSAGKNIEPDGSRGLPSSDNL